MSDYLTFCDESSVASFPDLPFATRHNLIDHPLLQLPALAQLAREIDQDQIEYSSGDLQPDQLPEDIRPLNMEPEKVIEQIETCGAWMVIKNVECMPEYRALLKDVLSDGARQAGYPSLEAARMTNLQCFIFVASANSVTPFHADNEDNLFVHLRGRKHFHVIDNEDRSVVSEADLESYPGKHRNLKYKTDFEDRAIVYDLSPGDGIFVPFNWPHWVETGDAYSISMQLTWRSPQVTRMNKLMFANAIMRSIGLPQVAPGQNPFLDKIKIGVYSIMRFAVEPIRRSQKLRQLVHGAFNRRHKDYHQSSEI